MKPHRPLSRVAAAAGIVALSVAISGCDSFSVTSSTTPVTSSAPSVVATDVRAKRYCEVLLVRYTPSGLTADVYNSYGLNDCPPSAWTMLDTQQIARENGALRAILNGPRYWLMDSIIKQDPPKENTTKTFGAIAMHKDATLAIGDPATEMRPYTPHAVNRQTVFTFDAGRQIYELVDQSGTRWVMQTMSQQKEPKLSEADLPGLAPRLALPVGWSYQPRRLSSPLDVITTSRDAEVLQDSLGNSYSNENSATGY